MTTPRPTASENFIEQMGLILQADGGPRIAGRIFGLLIVEGRPMSLHEMADRLEVSRASASTNARLLANGGVLRLISRPGDRQDYYELTPNPFQRILEGVGAKMRRAATQIAEAEALFTPAEADTKARVRQLAEQHRQSADFIEKWAARLQAGPDRNDTSKSDEPQ